MMKPGLTIGLMCWEEGETLERVLQLLHPVTDRFVIGVDRRSSDDTARIAREWAAELFEFDFRDNFSEIRNRVLDRCQTTWFLQVDGHEFLDPNSCVDIEEIKGGNGEADIVHIGLSIWDDWEPLLMLVVPRLFRADRGIRYTRAIHNTLTHEQGHDRYLNLPVRTEPRIMLDHRQPPRRHQLRADQRKVISVDLIQRQAEEWNDAFDWYNLGVLQTYLQDAPAAIHAFQKSLEVCERGDARYQIKLFLAGIFKQQGRRQEAKEVLATAAIDDPFRCEHLVELGALYEEEGNDNAALLHYGMAGFFPMPASQMTINVQYYSWFPVERRMRIYARHGDLQSAYKEGLKLKTYKFFRYPKDLESYLKRFARQLADAGIDIQTDEEDPGKWDVNIPSTMGGSGSLTVLPPRSIIRSNS